MADEIQQAGVALPEDLSELTDKGLTSLKEKIQRRFQQINSKERLTPDDLQELGVLADQFDTVKAAESDRAAAQEQASQVRAELAARMEGESAEAESEAPTVGELNGEGEEAPQEDESPAEEGSEEQGDEESQEDGVEQVAIAASARPKGGARAVPRPGPSTEVKPTGQGTPYSIVAAAGIDRVQMGARLDRDALSVALHERARMLPDRKGRGDYGALVASIVTENPEHDIRGVRDDAKLREIFNAAHDLQSLTASGGWCSPSQTIYDFACDFESLPETVDLPTITADRGGLRYPTSPLLADVFADADSGFTWTEADDIAAAGPEGPTKPCFVIPCPDFEETRLQAQGICITAGNLTDRAYPELTNRYVDLVMTAHAHRMNNLKIQAMVGASSVVPISPTIADLSATEAVLGGLELIIATTRDAYFMGEGQVLEVVAPRWLRSVVRRDLARRAGVDFGQKTDADIAAFFSEIGARVQFVSDWQQLATDATGLADILTWPTTVDLLVYPAGAFTLLDGGSIDLGVIRDSTLNATNDYTAAWTEEFWAVIARCAATQLTVPLCPNGWTGAPNEIACPTA